MPSDNLPSNPGNLCNAAETAAPPSCRGDVGYLMGVLLRRYIEAAAEVFTQIPGEQRGFQVLLVAGEGGCRNQATMAAQLGLDRTVMTYLVDELEAAGLVQRRPDPADRRSRQILLTDDGHATVARLTTQARERDRQVLAGLSDEDYEQFVTMLQRAGAPYLLNSPPDQALTGIVSTPSAGT